MDDKETPDVQYRVNINAACRMSELGMSPADVDVCCSGGDIEYGFLLTL